MAEEPMSYIGRDEHGCLVAACVDNPEHRQDVAKTLKEWVQDGLIVERVTCQYVRENFTGCIHEQVEETAQERLF